MISLLSSEPCYDFNVKYYSIEIDIVIDIQYNNVMFSITLTRNADNVCSEYIWCQYERYIVIKSDLISKRDSYQNFLSIIGGKVRNNTGVCLENKLIYCWNVNFCGPQGSLGRVNVHYYQSANGSLAVLALVTSDFMMALSTCSSLENSEAAGGVKLNSAGNTLFTKSDVTLSSVSLIKPGTNLFLEDSWEKCRHDTEFFFFSRDVPQVQTSELILGHGREKNFLGGTSDMRLRFLLLNVERRDGPVIPNSLQRSSMFSDWNTGAGSICNLNLIKIMLSPIQMTRDSDVRKDKCKVTQGTYHSRSVTSMWQPTLLRSEVIDSVLADIDVTIIVGGEEAIHRRGSGVFKRLSLNLFGNSKSMIEGKWGRVCVWKLSIIICCAVRELNLAINSCFSHDANPGFPTARPPVLTTRLCDADSGFVGALTSITITTVTEAANLRRLSKESAVRISRQKLCRSFAKCCATTGLEENKDVGTLIFIKEEISDQTTPDDTNYILTIAVIN